MSPLDYFTQSHYHLTVIVEVLLCHCYEPHTRLY